MGDKAVDGSTGCSVTGLDGSRTEVKTRLNVETKTVDVFERILLWLPVLLLPLANLITTTVTRESVFAAYTAPSTLIPFLPAAVVYILGAVAEELFYRWFLLKKVFFETTKLKPVLSILIVSALFAAMHLWNLQTSPAVLLQVFSAFCFSIWAGAVVWRTDRNWIPLIAHVLLNATAGGAEIAWVSVMISVVVLTDGIWLMRRKI